ncbi:hypothetical protein [Clostridium sp. BJN0001]|uniref:tetratricopeptide repeat protein n=1 Tax=Clostridium sp. BJN0001 TaxID=2930219 RepID=UPI001FD0D89B|nr:hypothetical protein [Clostridium sp. BJN0001]
MSEKLSIEKKKDYISSSLTMIITLVMILIISLLCKTIMGKAPNTKSITIAENSAEEAFYNRDYERSINLYEDLLKKDPWPLYKVKIAEIYSIQGDYDKSNALLQEAYEDRNSIIDTEGKEDYEDKDRELANYIVFTFYMNGEYKKALEYGEMFFKDYSDDKKLLKTMFTVYMTNHEIDKAKDIVNDYPEDDSDSKDLANLGRMYMLIDDYDNGFDLLKKAYENDKDEVKVFDVIAQIADYNKDKIMRKISDLSKKDEDEDVYKLWMAKIYSMSPYSAYESLDILNEIRDSEGDSINFKLIESNAYENSGDEEESNKILSLIISDKDKSFIGYHTAAWQEFNDGSYDNALDDCKKSILLNKDYADNYGFLIPEIMEKQNKEDEAEPYFRTALYKEPFNYNIMIKIAKYYLNTSSDNNMSLKYYNLASKIKPDDAEIYYNIALININEQNNNEAVLNLNKCIKIDPQNSKYFRTISTVYSNIGENEKALKNIKNAYALNKNDILTLNNAGCYYISVEGDIQRGMVNLKAAYQEMDEDTGDDERKIITDNYSKAKKIYDEYNKMDGRDISIPEFKLFY